MEKEMAKDLQMEMKRPKDKAKKEVMELVIRI